MREFTPEEHPEVLVLVPPPGTITPFAANIVELHVEPDGCAVVLSRAVMSAPRKVAASRGEAVAACYEHWFR